MDNKALLEGFYQSYDPAGAAKVDGILSKYAGSERDVMRKLDEKYNCSYFASVFQLEEIFKQHDPARVGSITTLLGKNNGREQDVVAKVREKFGVTGGGGGSTGGASPNYAARVKAIFEKYDAPKVANTGAFLEKYKGQEEAFIKKLVEKYGPEPAAGASPASGGGGNYAARVRAIFEKYDSPKAANTGAFLTKYKGQEEAFIAKLVDKYGPEPSAGASPAAGGGGGAASYAARVKALFEKYDPPKAANTDAFLAKYKGQEDAFIAKLVEKYGPEPASAAGASPAAAASAPGSSDHASRIRAIFEKYDPPKAANTDAFLAKYKGQEEAFIAKLVEKYGPEPAAPAAASPTGGGTPPNYATRIRAIFTKYDPPKAANTDAFLAKYKRQEEAFIKKLVEKYGPEPAAAQSAGAGATAPRDHSSRVRAMFEKYDPPKAANTDAFLAKYKGQEEAFIAKLVEKYGPEPAAPAAAAPAGGAAPAGASSLPPKPPGDWAARIEEVYKRAEPAKCGSAAALCEKYKGNEAAVFKKLIEKYGPEPYWVERLTRLFKANSKQALEAKIPAYLAQHAGNEEQLLQSLVAKIGPEPAEGSGGATPAAAAPAGHVMKLSKKAKIVRFLFYKDANVGDWLERLGPGGKYHGKEDELYQALLNKHQADPSPADPPKPEDTKARVVNMYAEYAPDKIGGVPTILEKYKERPEELVQTLVKKYGEEPCQTAPAGGAAPQKSYQERIEAIYQKYCPEKLANVPAILEKYKGKEDVVLQKLISTYGPEPADEGGEDWLERVKRFYLKYNPDKVDQVPSLVEKYKGREAQLVEGLVKKYGPEPEEEEEEEGTEREKQERREQREWAGLDADSRVMHEGERAARWDVEDQEVGEWDEVVAMQEVKRRLVGLRDAAGELEETNTMRRMKAAYGLWLQRLKDKIREEKRRHRELLDERMSIYDQLQTNKSSIRYYKQLAKRSMQEKEKRQKKFDAPPKTPPTRSRSASVKDFVAHNVRMASVSPSRRSMSPVERRSTTAASRRSVSQEGVASESISHGALEKVLAYQKKWLPREYRPPDYPVTHEMMPGVKKGFSSRKTLEGKHRDRVSKAAKRIEEEGDRSFQVLTLTQETSLDRAMQQLQETQSVQQIHDTQNMWNSIFHDRAPTPATNRSTSYDSAYNRRGTPQY